MARRLEPNEKPEWIAECKQQRPRHTAADWIEEALHVSSQHCEDHDIQVCTFLYCALEALKNIDTTKNQK